MEGQKYVIALALCSRKKRFKYGPLTCTTRRGKEERNAYVFLWGFHCQRSREKEEEQMTQW